MTTMITISDLLHYILYGILLYLFLLFQMNKLNSAKPKSYKKWIKELKKSAEIKQDGQV